MNTMSTLKVHIMLLLTQCIICNEMMCGDTFTNDNSHDYNPPNDFTNKNNNFSDNNDDIDNNIEDLFKEEVSIGLVATNVGLSAMLWKLIPYPVLMSYIIGNKEIFYGFSNGVCWYPRCLKFMNGDLRIGFFCLECRPLEFIVNLIHYKCSCWEKNLNSTCQNEVTVSEMMCYYYLGSIIPCYLYFLHLKYKFIRICFFSFFATLRALCGEWLAYLTMYYWSQLEDGHLSPKDNKKKLFIGDLIFFLIPYISIDISWFKKH